MIKFFRRIRYDLMEKNKTGKYLKYAIGEIVLVVIGILIALSINNWNETRKDQQELRNILQSIVVDMKEDVRMMKWASETLKKDNEKIKSFLNHHDYSGFTRDSLEQSLETFYVPMLYRMNSFYGLRDSGITEYGKYREVITGIKYYYDFLIPYINGIEEEVMKYVQKSDDFWRFEQNVFEFNYEAGLHSDQSDEAAVSALNSLLKSPTPRNIIKRSYKYNKSLISEYEVYLEIMDEEVKEIEDTLLEVN